MENTVKINALAAYLNESAEDITVTTYDENMFDAPGGEYLVLTDEEADEKAAEYIKSSLWAFRASFIASHCSPRLNDRAVKALEKMQGELCEDGNDLIAALINDIDSFIEDAIGADGRGHFLSQYDGNENEEEGEDGKTYYIYRTN